MPSSQGTKWILKWCYTLSKVNYHDFIRHNLEPLEIEKNTITNLLNIQQFFPFICGIWSNLKDIILYNQYYLSFIQL